VFDTGITLNQGQEVTGNMLLRNYGHQQMRLKTIKKDM
jgi:hypothetical protein